MSPFGQRNSITMPIAKAPSDLKLFEIVCFMLTLPLPGGGGGRGEGRADPSKVFLR